MTTGAHSTSLNQTTCCHFLTEGSHKRAQRKSCNQKSTMANGFTLFSEKYAKYAKSSNRAAGLVLACGMLHAVGVSEKAAAAEHPMFVYFGTYTGNKSHGIYVSRFDPNKGHLSSPELAAESK